jgi:hypothetical protein
VGSVILAGLIGEVCLFGLVGSVIVLETIVFGSEQTCVVDAETYVLDVETWVR